MRDPKNDQNKPRKTNDAPLEKQRNEGADNRDPHRSAPRVEGEGSYEATRRYDKGVQQTIESGRVPDLAKKARQAIDGPDAAELLEAEEKGKKPILPG